MNLTWDVPRGRRTYLLQQVLATGLTSAKTEVLARFVSFFRALRFAPSHEVRTVTSLVSRDLRTVTGRNLALVGELSGENPWTVSTHLVRESLRRQETVVPQEMDTWRCSYLSKLLEQRQEAHYLGMEREKEELNNLIHSLCLN